MRASIAYTLSRLVPAAILGTWVAVAAHAPASANVITDWDEKAVAFLQPRMVPPVAYRAMAIVHIAMFDAVNTVEPRYRPYQAQLPAMPDASKDAAAAAAAGAVLTNLLPDAASDIQAALRSYLSAIPDSDAKSNGIKLGDAVAAKILEARTNDGSSTADTYRPVTTPGAYIPTALTVAPQWPDLTPFTMTSPSQFRPKPPIALETDQWAKDYNEIKELGAKNSSSRSPRQTEDARFWLLTGPLSTHPLHRQIAMRKEMSVIDSARFMAVITVAEADAMIAVLDAKYKYAFWRPITAIRNGDIDGNAATEREATLATDRQHADASRISMRPLHRKLGGRQRRRSHARHGRHSRSGDDQPDGTRRDPSLDEPACLCGRGLRRSHRRGFPLPVLDRRG